MRHPLMTVLLIAAPMTASAQVPPVPPALPALPAPAAKPARPSPPVRITPKFDIDMRYKSEFELITPKLDELRWHFEDLKVHEFEAKAKFDAEELRWRAQELAAKTQWSVLEAQRIAQAEAQDRAREALEAARTRSVEAVERSAMLAEQRRALGAKESLLATRPRAAWAPEDPADSIYRLARESLNRGEYRRAAQLFNEVTTKYPKSQYALDCAYWEAFARYRVGTTDDLRAALRILEEGKEKFAYLRTTESSMDVQALRARVQGALAARGDAAAARQLQAEAAQSTGCDKEDILVRAEALGALGQMDLASAMPVVRKVLARRDECTVQLRQRALYLLGRQPTSESIPLMLDVAKNDTDPGIRGEAMAWLSRTGGDQAVPMLEDLLKAAPDERTQRSAVNALGSIDTERARRAIRTIIERPDANERVRSDAILSLARERDGRPMSAEDATYLRGLYAKMESQRLRESVLAAVSRADTPENVQFLLGIARSESEAPSLRAAALQRLGRMASVGFADIARLYEVADTRSMREQIISALGQRKEPEAIDKLVEVAKKDTDYNIRRYAIQILSRSNNPRAIQAIKELIDRP